MKELVEYSNLSGSTESIRVYNGSKERLIEWADRLSTATQSPITIAQALEYVLDIADGVDNFWKAVNMQLNPDADR